MTLQSIGIDHAAIAIHGALDLRRTEAGLTPWRLPAWTAAQMPDPALDLMASLTSGVRMAFTTDARSIALDALETGLKLGDQPRLPVSVDLTIGGRLISRASFTSGHTLAIDVTQRPPTVSFQAGVPGRIRFDDLPAGEKSLELWLPQSAAIELRDLWLSAGATLRPSAPPERRWAHYGSSISHALEAAGPSATWPAVAAQSYGVALTSLGFAGQCHLDGLVARTLRDLDVDLISLKLGVNIVNLDSMRERAFVPAVQSFIDTIRDAKPRTPILVISPILCPLVENQPGPTLRQSTGIRVPERSDDLAFGALSLRRIRALLEGIVEGRRARGDLRLFYLSGLTLFNETDLADLPDGLHPNAAGQQRMGERFAAAVFGAGRAFGALPLEGQA